MTDLRESKVEYNRRFGSFWRRRKDADLLRQRNAPVETQRESGPPERFVVHVRPNAGKQAESPADSETEHGFSAVVRKQRRYGPRCRILIGKFRKEPVETQFQSSADSPSHRLHQTIGAGKIPEIPGQRRASARHPIQQNARFSRVLSETKIGQRLLLVGFAVVVGQLFPVTGRHTKKPQKANVQAFLSLRVQGAPLQPESDIAETFLKGFITLKLAVSIGHQQLHLPTQPETDGKI